MLLARDYGRVGNNDRGSLFEEWDSGTGRLGSLGESGDNGIAISDTRGHNVQVQDGTTLSSSLRLLTRGTHTDL